MNHSTKNKILKTSLFLLLWISPTFSFAQISATMTMWKDTAIGAIWNKPTATVAYGKPDANGYYKIYLSDSLGNNETPLTYAGWPTDRHQWAEEWDSTGQYLFCYVEKATYAPETGHTRAAADAIPGYGAYTDVWLLKRDGTQAWQLTNVPNDYNHGVCHGAISQDGTKFAWTERVQAPNIWDPNLVAGAYVFKVADVTYGPTPSLNNIVTLNPNNVLQGGEVESISNDKTKIAVYSTFETQSIYNTLLYTIDINSGQTQRLTSQSFSQCPTYTPDGNHFVYMTGKDCDVFPWQLQGADWWLMNADSTNKIRLTYMNVTGNPQCVNQYRLAGSLSYMSNTSFLGGVMTHSFGLTGYTAKVSFSNILSVPENSLEENSNAFTLFPDPCQDIINLNVDEQINNFNVGIYNLTGEEVYSGNNIRSIDISGFAAGTYFVRLSNEKMQSHKIFIKE